MLFSLSLQFSISNLFEPVRACSLFLPLIMEAVAQFDFVATQADELTFQKGQIIKVSYYHPHIPDILYVELL